ncbi:MAG: hypothetical protein HZB10_00545 [Candidatus Yonathbacteria bacterium]|nr:hypothetical protein [Candidatus Yonathbacteria bacterium]
MDVHLIIFILSLIGIGECLYLVHCRRKKRAPVCITGGDCGAIWESPYSKTLGIHNEVLGIIFYTNVAVVETVLFLGNTLPVILIGEYVILFGGFIVSCYFFYLEWRVIQAWCFWCVLSAVIAWLTFAARFIF